MKKPGPLLRRALATLLVAAPAALLARAVLNNLGAVRAYPWRVEPGLLAASIAANVAVLVWGVWVWSRVQLRFAHAPVPFPALLRFWFLSNLARYVPGFQFLAVAQMSAAQGFRRVVMVTSLLVHTALFLLGALVLGCWTLGAHAVPAAPWLLGAAATLGALGAMHPAAINGGLALLTRLARRDGVRWTGSWLSGAELLALACGTWALAGGAYYLFLSSLTPLPVSLLPALAGVNALSFSAGLVVVVVPGGLGVRELTMTTLLSPYLPAGVAALLSAASRLWGIAAELIGGAGVALLARPSRADERASP